MLSLMLSLNRYVSAKRNIVSNETFLLNKCKSVNDFCNDISSCPVFTATLCLMDSLLSKESVLISRKSKVKLKIYIGFSLLHSRSFYSLKKQRYPIIEVHIYILP